VAGSVEVVGFATIAKVACAVISGADCGPCAAGTVAAFGAAGTVAAVGAGVPAGICVAPGSGARRGGSVVASVACGKLEAAAASKA